MTDIFEIVPPGARPLWVIGCIILFLILLAALFGYMAYTARNVRYEFSSEGLRIQGGFYGRTIPTSALMPARARRLDLTSESEFEPGLRTNGIGLPGYRAGWFRLRNQEKALVFLTDLHQVVYVPTGEGYALLLSVVDPDAFLERLRRQ